jgi:hypothetical protein
VGGRLSGSRGAPTLENREDRVVGRTPEPAWSAVRATVDRMEWTTHFFSGGREHALPGIVTDATRLGGVDVAGARVNRIQWTAQSDADISEVAAPDLVEFLEVCARELRMCAVPGGPWSAMLLTVAQESGSIGAFLVDASDRLARSGALAMISLAQLEAAAWELPAPDEDPDGFESGSQALQARVREALLRAAGTEPARAAIGAFRAETGLPILLDPLGETDFADFVPLIAD